MSIPKIRFKRFNDEWQSKQLKDIAKLSDGDWIDSEHITNQGEYRIIQTGNIGVGNFINNNKKYLPLNDFNILKANEIYPNDILISRLADPAGRAIIVPNINHKMVTVVDVAIMRPNHRYNNYFLISYLNSKKQLQRINVLATGSTRKRISRKNLEKIIIKLPFLTEQQQIGAFFSKLDALISAQSKKLTLLKQLKHGYLQRMFPQADQTKPRVRFSGFNDKWQSKKLSDFLSIPIKEKAKINSINDLITIKLNLNGVALSSRTTLSLTATNYYIRHSGQFIYGKQNFFNGAIAIIPKEFEGKATSGDVPALNIKNIDSMFLYLFVSRPVYFKNKKSMASGTGSKRIHEKTLLSFNISVPGSLQEQQRISSLFARLDHLIELQKHKLALLQQLKKGYLQKMFC